MREDKKKRKEKIGVGVWGRGGSTRKSFKQRRVKSVQERNELLRGLFMQH